MERRPAELHQHRPHLRFLLVGCQRIPVVFSDNAVFRPRYCFRGGIRALLSNGDDAST